MSKLAWDQAGEKQYETGVSDCALYVQEGGTYGTGVAWNGITKVLESPSGAEPTALYADNKKYLNIISTETFGATIEAYMYPDEFAECDGSAKIAKGVSVGQQSRKVFGLAYKTLIGNDTDGQDHGYKLHVIYGCTAKPSSKERSTVNESPEAITFSWEVATTPVPVTGKKPTASLEIDSTKGDATCLAKLEAKLFGGADSEPSFLLPDEIATIMTPAEA